MKVAFIDRDGTINKSFWQTEGDLPWEYWRGGEEPELLPGAVEGLKHLRECGYEIIIITNQYPIGEGQSTLEFYHRFTGRLLDKLGAAGVDVLDVLFCPHRRDAGCSCCKPRPGMIFEAFRKYPDIEPESSFFAGDSAADEGAAANAGLTFYGVGRQCANSISSLADLKRLIR